MSGYNKALAKSIKSKGLGQLRFYCQICEKQMRDENGFQAHCRSEPHLRKMISLGPNAGSAVAEFSRQFQYEFVTLLRTRHNTQRVRANAVYNEYIQDKHHVHMNATRWVTLSGFIMTLGKAGIVKVDEDDKGLWIQWIDNSPKTLAKQAALQKKERSTMDGEERERKMIEDQIARARAAAGADDGTKELDRSEGQKITISLGKKSEDEDSAEAPTPPSTSASASTSTSASASASALASASIAAGAPKISIGNIGGISLFQPAANPLKIVPNPLKRPAPTNVFKTVKAPKTDDEPARAKPRAFVSEAERLMKEDQARKAARAAGGYQGAGPRRR